MSDILSHLILIRTTSHTPKFIKPALDLIETTPLTEDERYKIFKLIQRARYDITITLQNFNAKLGILQPPTGYASTIHRDSTFKSDIFDRNIFRGLSIVPLSRQLRYTDSELESYCAQTNRIIRDSIHLGPNAWVGIYEYKGKRQKNKYFAIAVSSLTNTLYSEFYNKTLYYDGNKSIDEVMPIIQQFSEKATSIRIELLGLFLHAISETAITVTNSVSIPSLLSEETLKKTVDWLGKDTVVLQSYVMPKRNIKLISQPIPTECFGVPIGNHIGKHIQCTESVDTYVMDTIEPHTETHFVRCSGAMNKTRQFPQIRGPSHDVLICDAIQSTDAVPYIEVSMKCAVKDTPQNGYVFWEDPELTKNRMLHMEYQESTIENASVYEPVIVRCSCTAEDGYTLLMNSTGIKRLVGFCADSYVGV
jgi:hypothetical protein